MGIYNFIAALVRESWQQRYKSGRVIRYAPNIYVLIVGTECIGQITSLFLYAGVNYALIHIVSSPHHFHYGMRQYKNPGDHPVPTIKLITTLSRPLPVAVSNDELWVLNTVF